jgi:hypothetical protein
VADEIRTDERGRPLDRNEANLAVALDQGRISPRDVPTWRDMFRRNYEAAMSQLLNRPVRVSASEAAYRSYAERSGIPQYQRGAAYMRSLGT